jgi:4-aminobutyrate aminotransferase/(S)-3-amino-2-methylpropionate transaminase
MTEPFSPHSHTVVAQERKVVTELPGPKSKALHERRVKVISEGIPALFPVYADYAHDAVIVDVDGNHFVDFTGGIGVMTAGHTNDAVVDAVREQVGKVTHTLFGLVGYEPYIRAGELLAEHTPGNFPKKSMFINSGAEAVENAVKIARKYTGRTEVAVLHHGYHGRTNLTASMNYNMHPYGTGFGPLAGSVHHAPNSYPLHDGLDGDAAAKKTINHLEKRVGASQIACLVVEPIQGEGGFIVPADGYLDALVKWCRDNGILFVSDEVQSGMLRTGYYFASEMFGIEPDLLTSAKGIGGGMPIAAVTGRAEIMDSVHPGGLGGTFGGNPVAAAALVAVFEDAKARDLLGEAKRVERTFRAELEKLQAKYPLIAEVRGAGAMLSIELLDDKGEPAAAAAKAIQQFGFENGVLFLTAGTFGNVMRFLPSVVISDELIKDASSVLDQALASL